MIGVGMVKKENNIVLLDDVDVEIIRFINNDVRTSYRHISRNVGISVANVSSRVKKLIKFGVIKKYSVIIDYDKLGFGFTTIIGLKFKNNKINDWEEKILSNKNVVAIYEVNGEFDFFIITKFMNFEDWNVFIKDISKDLDVKNTNSQIVLEVIKEDMGFLDISSL